LAGLASPDTPPQVIGRYLETSRQPCYLVRGDHPIIEADIVQFAVYRLPTSAICSSPGTDDDLRIRTEQARGARSDLGRDQCPVDIRLKGPFVIDHDRFIPASGIRQPICGIGDIVIIYLANRAAVGGNIT
jgi:hypothetical protein